mgnify:CR=1 FL=1
MNKFNEFKNLYKQNRKLFNIVILVVNFLLFIWQSIVSLIVPSRLNVFILLVLVILLLYQLVKDIWFNKITSFICIK